MKNLKYISAIAFLIAGMAACTTTKSVVSNSDAQNFEIHAVAGKDGVVKDANGEVIGKMDKEGNLYDLSGNRIGERKRSDAELIRDAAF